MKATTKSALLARVTRRQRKKYVEIQTAPKKGRIVQHRGRHFVAHPGVFWAFYDNRLLDIIPRIISPSDRVLDIGTGTGIMAILAANAGAGYVLAADINRAAVLCARENVRKHHLQSKIHVRQSDVYSALGPDEKFDVVLANLPFRNKKAADIVEASMWDTHLHAHRAFFQGLEKHLKPDGKAYLCQANYGAVKEVNKMALAAGFSVRRIAAKKFPANHELAGCEFYAFEIRRKKGSR